MKGKLPVTEKMVLKSAEAEWNLLSIGLIRELRTSAIVEISPNQKVRINLVINNVLSPNQITFRIFCKSTSNLGIEESQGFNRIASFVGNIIEKDNWILFGYIDGENKTPIIIVYYSTLNMFVYTQKTNAEAEKDFLKISRQN